MGERLANAGLSERLLGLDQKLIDRLQPLPGCCVFTYPPEIPILVRINWSKPEGFYSNPGFIEFFFANEIDSDGGSKDFNPNMLTSYFTPLEPFGLNPFGGLSAISTIMATINKTARVLEEDFLHLVRANIDTRPYFQRFQEAGLYKYCDARGRTKRGPVVINGYELYVCQYPVEGIDSVIGKFVVDEAVGEIIRMREERLKDYEPHPFRNFVKSLVSS